MIVSGSPSTAADGQAGRRLGAGALRNMWNNPQRARSPRGMRLWSLEREGFGHPVGAGPRPVEMG